MAVKLYRYTGVPTLTRGDYGVNVVGGHTTEGDPDTVYVTDPDFGDLAMCAVADAEKCGFVPADRPLDIGQAVAVARSMQPLDAGEPGRPAHRHTIVWDVAALLHDRGFDVEVNTGETYYNADESELDCYTLRVGGRRWEVRQWHHFHDIGFGGYWASDIVDVVPLR